MQLGTGWTGLSEITGIAGHKNLKSLVMDGMLSFDEVHSVQWSRVPPKCKLCLSSAREGWVHLGVRFEGGEAGLMMTVVVRHWGKRDSYIALVSQIFFSNQSRTKGEGYIMLEQP